MGRRGREGADRRGRGGAGAAPSNPTAASGACATCVSSLGPALRVAGRAGDTAAPIMSALCAQRNRSGEGRAHAGYKLTPGARIAAFPQMRAKLTQLLQLTKLFDNVNPFTEAEVGDWVLPDEVVSATRENSHNPAQSCTIARAAAACACMLACITSVYMRACVLACVCVVCHVAAAAWVCGGEGVRLRVWHSA